MAQGNSPCCTHGVKSTHKSPSTAPGVAQSSPGATEERPWCSPHAAPSPTPGWSDGTLHGKGSVRGRLERRISTMQGLLLLREKGCFRNSAGKRAQYIGLKIPPFHSVLWKRISTKLDPCTSAQIHLSLLHKWTQLWRQPLLKAHRNSPVTPHHNS